MSLFIIFVIVDGSSGQAAVESTEEGNVYIAACLNLGETLIRLGQQTEASEWIEKGTRSINQVGGPSGVKTETSKRLMLETSYIWWPDLKEKD
eukprot:m.91664 g.91664  ORF g.91664 m.91664 type:complete len:93 (+) comp13314_c0_seq3:733-1011(+)